MDEVECVSGGVAPMNLDDLDEVSLTGTRPKRPAVGFTVSDFLNHKNGLGPEQTADFFWAGTYSILPSLFSTRYWDMTRSDDRPDYTHVAAIKAGDNHLLFEQASGDLYVIAPDGSLKLVAQGYSGAAGDSRNNPSYEDKPFVGPTPLGTYQIGKSDDSTRHGKTTMSLTAEWQENNRDELLIHGDNKNHDASQGCIVLHPTTREEISKLDGAILEVVRHVPAAGVFIYNR